MKKYFIPLLLVLFMILNIICAIIFHHWIFIFVASQLILFHLVPPFAVLLSMIVYKNKLSFWFKQNSMEKAFYKKIKVKQWKDKFPTYDSKLFTINSESKENIIKAMIQSENVHLLLVFFSFIPLLLSHYFGHFCIMLLLCVIFSAVHIPFVIIQRYNLPRIIKLPN